MRIQLFIVLIIFVNCHFALKVLSFADDNDDKADENGEFTSASLEKKDLPESFTMCAAFSAEDWNIHYKEVAVPTILTDSGDTWGYVRLEAGSNYTKYNILSLETWR